jgi:hypothetical protein
VLGFVAAATMPVVLLLLLLLPAVLAVLILPVMRLVMLATMWRLLGAVLVTAANVLPHVLGNDDCRNRTTAPV